MNVATPSTNGRRVRDALPPTLASVYARLMSVLSAVTPHARFGRWNTRTKLPRASVRYTWIAGTRVSGCDTSGLATRLPALLTAATPFVSPTTAKTTASVLKTVPSCE